jgi:hypothetical protein
MTCGEPQQQAQPHPLLLHALLGSGLMQQEGLQQQQGQEVWGRSTGRHPQAGEQQQEALLLLAVLAWEHPLTLSMNCSQPAAQRLLLLRELTWPNTTTTTRREAAPAGWAALDPALLVVVVLVVLMVLVGR